MIANVPKPSRYVSHARVEEIASICHELYVERLGRDEVTVDPEEFVDLCLDVSILWETIEEPPGSIVFATYDEDTGRGRVTLNTTHRPFFETRPEILRSAVGHEAGHSVLGHYGLIAGAAATPTLFGEVEEPRRLYNRGTWVCESLTREEIAALRELAAHDETARVALKQIDDVFEPEWMYRQAQHFAMALLIPRRKLDALLEESWDFSRWRSVYELARHFQVSPSMMRVRLSKLGIIVVGPDQRIRPGEAGRQPKLL